MLDVINAEFDASVRPKYLEAAKAFRLPYFDYFRPRGGNVVFGGIRETKDDVFQGKRLTSFPYDFTLPAIFNEKEVAVALPPLGKPDKMANPLYTFKFGSDSGALKGDDLTMLAVCAEAK